MTYGRLATIVLTVLGGALLLRIVWYVARLPESNCASKSIGTFWNADRAFKATLLEKDCNAGETLFYVTVWSRPHSIRTRERSKMRA
jgi:hypothetical protein